MTFDSSVHGTPLSVEVTLLLYHVSAVIAAGAYVASVAPAIGAKAMLSALLIHWYAIVPSAVAATEVNAAGMSPSQTVCAVPIVPGVRLLTVTLTTFVISVHVTPDSVEMTDLLYHVSAVSAGGVKVSLVAPVMFEKEAPSRLLCHWYVKVPSPVGITLISAAGVEPEHIVWSIAIDPGTKLFTVTFIAGDCSTHDVKLSVAVTVLLNQVSTLSAGDVYVAEVAPPIDAYVMPSVLFSHR